MPNHNYALFTGFDFVRALKGHDRNGSGYARLHVQDSSEHLRILGIRMAAYLRDAILEGQIPVEDLRQLMIGDKKLGKKVSAPIQNHLDRESNLERELRKYARLGIIDGEYPIGEAWTPIRPDYILREGPHFHEARVEMKLILNSERGGIYDAQWSNGMPVWTLAPQDTLVIDPNGGVRSYTAKKVRRKLARGEPL